MPLIDFRTTYAKANGSEPPFTSRRANRERELGSADPFHYSETRRKLALLCAALGDPNGESHTLRSPKNLFPTSANQVKFDTPELHIAGHWSSSAKMQERCDRSVRATELLLRNTIIQKVVDGWALAPSFRIPETVPSDSRIGKAAEGARSTSVPPASFPVSLDFFVEHWSQLMPTLADSVDLTHVVADDTGPSVDQQIKKQESA